VALNIKIELAEIAIAIATAFVAHTLRDISTLVVFFGLTVLFSLERIKEDYDKSNTEGSEK
jgi:hypothetical protein